MSKRNKSSNKNAPQARSETSVRWALRSGLPAGVVLIIVVVFFAYLPSLSGGFVLDDGDLLTNNPLIKSPDGLYRFWCTTKPTDYWPVTNTTLWIEWRLWGMHSTGYHVTNFILHIVESLLIWFILRKLSIPGAFLAAIIFALHPVNVESVAWITQRKNLMAMLFLLLSMLWYLKYLLPSRSEVDSSRHTPCAVPAHGVCGLLASRWYWLSLAAFVLAMLSKGSVAVLPVLLLGIVWWQRGVTRRDLLPTAPFFLVAAALAEVNVWFQTHGSAEVIRTAGFQERLLAAGGMLWFYLYKALLPVDLAFIYPQWHIETGNLLWWLPLLGTLVFTAMLWRYKKVWGRPLLFAWGFFCVALMPVMGLTDVGFMKYSLVADRYQHIAIIGVIALVAAPWNIWRKRVHGGAHWSSAAVAIVALGTLAFLTWRQSGFYSDPITLYQKTLEKNPECWLAHNNLGLALDNVGRSREAIEHYEQALRLKPGHIKALNNLGVTLTETGRPREAILHLQQALVQNPDYIEAHYNLGNALQAVGQYQQAIDQYQKALQIEPDFPEVHNNLGNSFKAVGQYQQALEHYNKALRLKPDYIEALNNLGLTLVQTGRTEEAIEHYQQALRLKPDFAQIQFNLALAYLSMHQSSLAITTAQKALELARSKGQTAIAKQIEDWLTAHPAGQ